MFLPKSNTPRWVIILIDLFLSFIALLFAYLIRFDLKADKNLIQEEWQILSKSIIIFAGIKLITFYLFKIHKGLVRHTSTEDLRRISLALATSSLIFALLGIIRYLIVDEYYLFPTSVLIMEFLISVFLLAGSRFAVKLIYLESMKIKDPEERVLIYGAGISGLITKRTIEKDLLNSVKIIGFIDDNKRLAGNRLEGVNIHHTNKLERLIIEEGVNKVILAIQDPNEENRRRVVELCIEKEVEVQKVPSTRSWINGEFSTKQISKINIEDLLGRKPIVLDENKMKEEFSEKVIMISGAAGSIGSGIVRQLANYNPSKVILLDQAESPTYDFQNILRAEFPRLQFEIVIGDIRNRERISRIFDIYQPSYVFHAAAYKHVPLMEDNPSESVLTNIKGTKNLVDIALDKNVQKFVMISTDKAVNPTNVMGASKRIAEIYAQYSNAKGNTKFITTRFGNVLGSNGSVIPLFERQIEQGGPVTVTDENVTRFFMTIPEACQLVLDAGAMGEGGEIFVFDMGESVKIIDLAKKMIRLSGLEVGKDIEIKLTGLRPGEKLYEELLSKDENTLPTHHPKILKAKERISETSLEEIESLINLLESQDNIEIVKKMKEIIPEFKSNNSTYEKLD